MTRKLAGFGLAFALAELAAAYLPPLASLLTAALFISLFLFAAFTQRRAARFALPAVAGLLAGLVWSAAYQLAVVKPAQSLAGQTYACTAIVQPDAETSWQPGNVRATLLITQLDGRKTSLKVYCTDLPYSEAGNIITGQFQLQPLRADSYRMSRYAKGTWLGASYQADYIWQGTSDALPYRLYHLRQAFAKRLTTYLPQNLAGVEAAMLLGEKSELTDEWSDTFRTAGIAHLLAVSGLHVALLCGLFAMGQGRRSRFSVPRVLLQITVLLLYMGLTGLPFSVFRAGVMFLIMLVGKVKVGDVTKGSVFAAGINAVIAIFGIAWMGSTFYTGNAEAINQSLSGMVAEAPFTFAVALFVMSVMLFSQAATVTTLYPLGLALGISPLLLVAMFPAVNGYFFLPNYPTEVAAINFDRTGTTRVGRWVINHSFQLPGFVTTFVAIGVGYLITLFL